MEDIAEQVASADGDSRAVDVSVIIPVYNCEKYLDECLASIYKQAFNINVEVSIFLDSCTDGSSEIVQKWKALLEDIQIFTTIGSEHNASPKGVGYAKNKAVRQSKGRCLCFMDADDVMHPDRIQVQYQLLQISPYALIGSGFTRSPPESTRRYTHWANSLSPLQLHTQVFTSHGPTVIMPTWFCSRSLYDVIGGFSEKGRGEPEDLIFFYSHLRRGGKVVKASQELLVYRYHDEAASFAVSELRIWELRVRELEERVLEGWPRFTIWSAGKQGRRLYRSLSQANRDKVDCFCDVDVNKIGKHYTFEHSDQLPKPRVPIVHFGNALPPFILCVKMDLTAGQFEENLNSLKLLEGKDYYHFN